MVAEHSRATALGSEAFSVVAYAQPGTDSYPETLLDYGHPDGDRRLRVTRSAAGNWRVAAAGSAGSADVSVSSSPITEPTQVAVTRQHDDGLGVFVDGVRRGSGDDPGVVAGTLSYLVVGGDRPGEVPWRGWIGPVAVFPTALDERELSAIDSRLRE